MTSIPSDNKTPIKSSPPIVHQPKQFGSKFIPTATSPKPKLMTSKALSPQISSKFIVKHASPDLPKATECLKITIEEPSRKNSTHSLQTQRNSTDLKFLQVPGQTEYKHATSPPSRNNSIQGARSAYIAERHSGERERQLEGIIEKLQAELDRYKTIIEQKTSAFNIMQSELQKSTLNNQRDIETFKIGTNNLKTHQELDSLKLTVQKTTEFLVTALTYLSEYKNLASTYKSCIIKSMTILNTDNLKENIKINEIRKILQNSNEIPQNTPFQTVYDFINSVSKYKSNSEMMQIIRKPKENNEIIELKNTNAILLEHVLDLERAIGEMESTKAIRDTDMCWGIKEILRLCKEKEKLQEMNNTLKNKYDEYIKRPIKPAQITKLAQILAYLPKRGRKYNTERDKYILELLAEIEKLKEMLNKPGEYKNAEYENLLKKYNELLKKYSELQDENSKLKNENGELKRKIIELLGLIKIKDAIIENLKKELELAKQNIDRLMKELEKLQNEMRAKDALFMDKMREMRQLFEEMRKEKEDKQKEIMILKEKLAQLEKELADLKNKLAQAMAELDILRSENEKLREDLDRYFSNDTLDGFKALVSLANMILARTKRPPPLSNKDKQLIKDIFDTNIKGMLDEIARQQEESKLYREELRKLLSQHDTYLHVFKLGQAGKVFYKNR